MTKKLVQTIIIYIGLHDLKLFLIKENILAKIKNLNIGIKNFLKSFCNKNQILLVTIQKNWKKIVGNAIYFHSQPYKITNERLFVYVNDNIWINELSLVHDEIKDKINNFIKENKIQKVFFKFNPEIKITEKNPPKEKIKEYFLPPEKEKEITILVSKIEDPHLRNALKHYFTQIFLIEK